MEDKKEYSFGEKITISHKLKRVETINRTPGQYDVYKEWKPVDLPKPTEVIVIGKRQLSDGEVFRGYGGEPTTFQSKVRFKAYLVVANMNTRPFFIVG